MEGWNDNPWNELRTRNHWPYFLFLAVWLLGLPAVGGAQTPNPSTCQECHDEESQAHKNSAHASTSCATCHVRHEQFPHPKHIPKPKCAECHAEQASAYARSAHGLVLAKGNEAAPVCETCHGEAHEVKNARTWAFRAAIPKLCGDCHKEIGDQYRASVHGRAVAQGIMEAPVCITCHGEHAILSPTNVASSVNPSHIRDTCAQCHGNVRLTSRFGLPPDRILSFDASFHGMALRAGNETVANCASCHGIHLILESSDPHSTINPKNLATTCGKCHAGAGTRFALGTVHELAGGAEPKGVRWVRSFYLVMIPLVVGLMLLHNLGDWVRKTVRVHLRRTAGPAGLERSHPRVATREAGDIRMYGFERLEHALLLISFTVLAWSGFALKYSGGWWARPLLIWESSWSVRGMMHRFAAAVFIGVGILHLVSLISSKRLRRHWRVFWPRANDVREALSNLGYNLGWRREKPGKAACSYVQKAEYWAVVWGAVIMGVSGIMLWADSTVLAWFPKSVLDFAAAVHLYEAILAVLAIVVWHFYWVIFDPDVYPMDTAWLTGRGVETGEKANQEPAETVGPEEKKGGPA